jgi:hypothetical protein
MLQNNFTALHLSANTTNNYLFINLLKKIIMATKNLISAAIPQTDISEIKTAIQTIIAKTPFLISLTDDQRKGGLKLGDKTVGFVDKVVDYLKTNPYLIPAYLDTAEFKKDYQLTKELLEILRILRPLVQNMEDTATEAGIEALSAALVYYNAVKTASKQGIEGAKVIYEDLQRRFPGGSGNKTQSETPGVN